MEITRHGIVQTTNGAVPTIGQQLPDFTLTGAAGDKVTPADFAGKLTLISVVPDINTRVCSLSTKKFNVNAANFTDINFITVSTNLPSAQQTWCAAEGVQNMVLLSDAEKHFGQAMGLYVAENNTDARSVWIADADGKIVYRELVLEQTEEPDYSSALAYLETHQN